MLIYQVQVRRDVRITLEEAYWFGRGQSSTPAAATETNKDTLTAIAGTLMRSDLNAEPN
jgi:hypothetical protein